MISLVADALTLLGLGMVTAGMFVAVSVVLMAAWIKVKEVCRGR